MEWWQWILIFALLVIATGYAGYRAMGAEKFGKLIERTLGAERIARLTERCSGLFSRFGMNQGEKPAKPVKMQERPQPTPASDSRQAAKDSLRRFFGRMR